MQCIQEVIRGENEVPKPDFHHHTSDVLPSSGQGLLRPSNPPSEDRIQQLTDMVFGRGAAVRALTRTGNNVSIATEYLLTHPFDAADDEGPATPQAAQENHAPAPENAEVPVDATTAPETTAGIEGAASTSTSANDAPPIAMETDELQPRSQTEPQAESTEEDSPQVESQGTAEERRKKLDDMRFDLQSDLPTIALSLADAHPTLIFDVREAFFEAGTQVYQPSAVSSVIKDIRKFSPQALDIQEEPLAVRCRLLALMLTDSPKDVLDSDQGKVLMTTLLAILMSQRIGDDQDQPLPKWLSALLLAMESLLVLAEEPAAVPLVLPDDPVTIPELFKGPLYPEARSKLFDLSLRLLELPNLPRDELLASLRIVVQLTRDQKYAQQFVKQGGISLLLPRLKGPSSEEPSTLGFQSHIAIILRHLMEDKDFLHSAMKHEISNMFNRARSKSLDLLNYVRSAQGFSARDPAIFIETTKELCVLARPDVTQYQLILRPSESEKAEDKADGNPLEPTTEKTQDSPAQM